MRKMKDSGVDWIGEIPKDWHITQTRRLFRNEKNIVGDAADEYERLALTLKGVIKRSKNDSEGLQPEKFEGYQILRQNELVFKMIDLENVNTSRVGLSPYTGLVSPAYIVLKNDSDDNRYEYYWFMSMYYNEVFNHLGGDGVRSALNVKDMLSLPIPNISKIQKKTLADYLDAKCSKIDEIIEKQQAIIEKLKEYKLSIITEAVTSGINPDVEMKDSGSVWFGSIPTNWEMKRLKYVFHIQKDIAGEEGHTVLSITQRGIIPKDFSNNEGQFANSYANYQLVHKGDFAMNHMDLLTGWVDISKYEGVTSPDYRVFVLNDKNGMCPKYYLYMMQMCYSARIFYGLGQGVSGMGRWRLQADKFLNFYIPIPPYDEQKKIADYITDKVNHIEVEIDKRNKLIKKYQEYKKSLIYEVVTGKKEV